MFNFDGKTYRNMMEQVQKNKADIEYILNTEGTLNSYGIKVVGQVDSAVNLPKKADYEVWPFDYGDAFAVGIAPPYTFYIWTRAFGAFLEDHWFNVGQLSIPGPVGPQGPEGPTGRDGPIGPVGPQGKDGPVGPQGPEGKQGLPGNTGATGAKGDSGVVYVVLGVLSSSGQLPSAAGQQSSAAYIVTEADGDHLYGIIQNNGANAWYDWGGISQGAKGEKGDPGIGINTLQNVQFPYGEATVTYDTTDGITVNANAAYTYKTSSTDTQTITVIMQMSIPIIAGDGITIDASEDGKKMIIKNADHDALSGKLDKQYAAAGTEKLYGVSGTSQEMYTADAEKTTASTIVKRRTDGSMLAEKTTETDMSGFLYKKSVVNNETFDAAMAKKLNIQTTQEGRNLLYGVSGATQNMYTASADTTSASTVVIRGTDGSGVFNQGKSIKSAVILNTIEPVVISPTSPEETTGTITDTQLSRLRQSTLSSVNTRPGIYMNNEYYYPMDKEHNTGYLGYTHVGYVDSQFIVKNITITISTKKWVLTKADLQPKLYYHTIMLNKDVGSDDPGYQIVFEVKSTSPNPYNSYADLYASVVTAGAVSFPATGGAADYSMDNIPFVVASIKLTSQTQFTLSGLYITTSGQGGASVETNKILSFESPATFTDTVRKF